jgi:hypothetical protein
VTDNQQILSKYLIVSKNGYGNPNLNISGFDNQICISNIL